MSNSKYRLTAEEIECLLRGWGEDSHNNDHGCYQTDQKGLSSSDEDSYTSGCSELCGSNNYQQKNASKS